VIQETKEEKKVLSNNLSAENEIETLLESLRELSRMDATGPFLRLSEGVEANWAQAEGSGIKASVTGTVLNNELMTAQERHIVLRKDGRINCKLNLANVLALTAGMLKIIEAERKGEVEIKLNQTQTSSKTKSSKKK
jgi:hypothetical protein